MEPVALEVVDGRSGHGGIIWPRDLVDVYIATDSAEPGDGAEGIHDPKLK